MKLPLSIASLVIAFAASGCASHYIEAADREQSAADSMRGADMREASQAAQQRADKNREAAKCKDFMECSLDVIGQVVLGLLGGTTSGKNK